MSSQRRAPCDKLKLRGALYCAAGMGSYCLVGGGGGGGNMGIPNKIYCIEHSNGKFGEVVSEVSTGRDVVRKWAISQNKSHLIVALQSGAMLLVLINTASERPTLEIQENAELSKMHQVNCLAFSSNGRWLGLALEDSTVEIRAWPSLRKRLQFRCGENPTKDVMKDMSFSSSHNDKVLAAIHEDKSCKLWELMTGTLIESVRLPEEMIQKQIEFSRVSFLDGCQNPTIVTAAHKKRQGMILTWEQDFSGEIRLRKNVKACDSTISALAVSPDQKFIGVGTTDGDMAVVSTDSWKAVRRKKTAHMIFSTDVSFSSSSLDLLSVSADASICSLHISSQTRKLPSSFMPILIAIFAIFISCISWYLRQTGKFPQLLSF